MFQHLVSAALRSGRRVRNALTISPAFRVPIIAALVALACVAPASAQLTLTGAGRGAPAPGSNGGMLTWRGHYDTTADVASGGNYTRAAADLGAASADRIIVVGIISGASGVSAYGPPTVAGVTMTRANSDPAGGTVFTALWYGSVPSGATGDIVVPVTSGALSRISIDWWSITGSTQTAPTAVSNSPALLASATSVTTSTFTVPAGGVSIAIARSNLSGISPSFTCTQVSCSVRTNAGTGGESQWNAAADASGGGPGQSWTFNTGSVGQNAITALVWAP